MKRNRILAIILSLVMALSCTLGSAFAASYKVEKGDSLWKIAKEQLGSGYKWSEIYNANRDKIKNPNLIFVGQVLEIPGTVDETTVDYAEIHFDFTDEITQLMDAVALVPALPEIPLTVADAKGATGVQLVAAVDAENTTDYYLNALVAGNELVFTAEGGIVSAVSNLAGELTVKDGSVSMIPAPISAAAPVDEVITVTLTDGSVYKVHTISQYLPEIKIIGSGVDADNAGVYSFAIDKVMLRVNTAGELVYYRDLNCVGERMAENFATQETADGTFYTAFVELKPEWRNANGGYSSGMYVVMDENFSEIDYVTMLPNTEEHHVHGQGYLDQHEFVVLGKGHYLNLSYTPLLVDNMPAGVEGINGGSSAYVWAGIFQEIKDGVVLHEINTADYPLLYASAVEKIDYAGSTDQGIEVNLNGNMVYSLADGWMDYVHPNSLDYTLDKDGKVDKLLVSMRDQCAVYQFDIDTGAIDWILGGKASTLTGYEAFTNTRADEKGVEFTALTYAQHYARYSNKNADGTLSGNPEISVFDNQTGMAPFFMKLPVPTLTRTFKVCIDETAKTAKVYDVINGTDMNKLSEGYHNASHCGSVDYFNANSVMIGWGLHGVVDNIGPFAPHGTMSDIGFEDLRAGSRPIFTEYDMENGEITFELYVTRNPNIVTHEALFSYRTYKSAK